MKYSKFFLIAFALMAALVMMKPARAASAPALTVTDCSNDNDLRNKVNQLQNAQGGMLKFDCGDATITLTSQLPAILKETSIDGGERITLSGNNQVRLFAVATTGKLTLKNITLEKGQSSNGTGGAIDNAGSLRLEHTTLRSNSSNVDGGGVYTIGPLTILESTFELNLANNGGAIAAMPGLGGGYLIEITNTTFGSNTARDSYNGGAIDSGVPVLIHSSFFFDNTAGGGGGAIHLHNTGESSKIDNSDFVINKALGGDPNGNGGALLLYQVQVIVERAKFTENRATMNGGALYLFPNGELTLSESTLDGNRADSGAAVYNRAKTLSYANTFIRNSATDHGGAIDNVASLLVYNSTFTKNQADYGGVLYNESGNAQLAHVTISNNRALVSASGILNGAIGSPGLSLRNVIVANSEQADSCLFQTPPLSSTFNLSTDNSCQFGTGRDRVLINLAPLADNGGPTQTFMPLSGSPAIDGGTNADFAVDQRGVSRPRGNTFDVGAVEAQPDCSTKPNKPMLMQPGNKEKVEPFGAALDWSDPQCAQKYKVLIRVGSPHGAKFQRRGNLLASYLITRSLTPGKTYAWRVIAVNNKGKTRSEWRTFKATKEK